MSDNLRENNLHGRSAAVIDMCSKESKDEAHVI